MGKGEFFGFNPELEPRFSVQEIRRIINQVPYRDFVFFGLKQIPGEFSLLFDELNPSRDDQTGSKKVVVIPKSHLQIHQLNEDRLDLIVSSNRTFDRLPMGAWRGEGDKVFMHSELYVADVADIAGYQFEDVEAFLSRQYEEWEDGVEDWVAVMDGDIPTFRGTRFHKAEVETEE